MQRHKNMFPAKEQAKIPEKELNETKISSTHNNFKTQEKKR